MSHLYKTRFRKFSSTEFNENWFDSWEYLEERLKFFLEFSVDTPLLQWALRWKKRDLNSQKCHKTRDLKTRTRQNSTKSNSMVRCYSGAHLEFFFRIFRPYPAPAVGLKVEKTRFYLLKHRKTFILRRKVGKAKFINISYQYNYIMWRCLSSHIKKTRVRRIFWLESYQ